MGDFEPGKIVVYIIIYYMLLFIVVVCGQGIASYYHAQHQISMTSPNFNTNNFISDGTCDGKSDYWYFLYNEPICGKIENEEIKDVCESYSGCIWENYTSIFGLKVLDSGCYGFINWSAYNLNESSFGKKTFCSTLNVSICEFFGCKISSFENFIIDTSSSNGVGIKSITTMIWSTVKGFITLNVNFGLPVFWEGFLAVILFYIPLVLLGMAIWRVIIP